MIEINNNKLIEKLSKKSKKLDPDLADFYEALEDIKNGNVTSYNSLEEVKESFKKPVNLIKN